MSCCYPIVWQSRKSGVFPLWSGERTNLQSTGSKVSCVSIVAKAVIVRVPKKPQDTTEVYTLTLTSVG